MSRAAWMQRMLGRSLLLTVGLVAVLLFLPSPASAHAMLASSSPVNGASVSRVPDRVVLTFTEQPDASLSSIAVFDHAGDLRSVGLINSVPGQPDTLWIAVHGTNDGVYTVTWRA